MGSLMAGVSSDRQQQIESRLSGDVIAWLTTVRPGGQPDTVPVWFVWTGDKILIYSKPNQVKQRNLISNSKVSVVLDDTKQGYDVLRIEGNACVVRDHPSLDELPAYVEKYAERIVAIGYGNATRFAAHYSEAIVVTPTKIRGFRAAQQRSR